MTLTKVCVVCETEKEHSEFHANKQMKDGKDSRCKLCKKTIAKERYTNDWFKATCILKKSWCSKNGVPYDLDPVYLEEIWTGNCPVFDRPFIKHDKTQDMSPALDRIDPNLGYVKGNVKYISSRANRIKYDASVDELKKVLDYMQSNVL